MSKHALLSLPASIPDKEKKPKLNFCFHTSLWCLKRLRPSNSHLKMTKIEKNKQLCRETSVFGLSKYVKIKALSPVPFPGKIQLLFAVFELVLPVNRSKVTIKSKGYHQNLTNPI